jgi:hypothetical protein
MQPEVSPEGYLFGDEKGACEGEMRGDWRWDIGNLFAEQVFLYFFYFSFRVWRSLVEP